MMGKDQIRSPAVNVVSWAEMGQRYRGVFDVPTRSPFSPRAVPENLSRFLTLPNDKIARVSLVRVRVNAVDRNPSDFVDRKSTRLNSSHVAISYAVFCLKKKTPATDA